MRGHPDAVRPKAPVKPVEVISVLMKPGVSVNGNRFSKEVLRRAVADAQGRIAKGMYGVVEPQGDKLQMADISHQVTDLEITSDGVVYGTIETIDTPKGRSLRAMLTACPVYLVPEGNVVRKGEGGVIEEMELVGVSVVRTDKM